MRVRNKALHKLRNRLRGVAVNAEESGMRLLELQRHPCEVAVGGALGQG